MNDTFLETEVGDDTVEVAAGGFDRARPLRRGDVLAARYEIQALLGRGGMASVYRAYDRVTEETIAVKVLDPERSVGRGWVEHLGRELRHARRIQHPNVCRVFDFFEDGGRCFLTMELALLGSLRDTLSAGGERSLAERLADARGIIDGVAAIHGAGVVHRDLKPENILRGADGRLMVSDLGVAVREDVTTQPSGAAGTRAYMAPEVFFDDRVSKAGDVWSLGVALYELLQGARPAWVGTGRGRRLTVPAVRVASEGELLALCSACLTEDPARRLPDGAAVRDRFDGIVGRMARPRWRPWAVAGVLCALVLGALLVGPHMAGAADGREENVTPAVSGLPPSW